MPTFYIAAVDRDGATPADEPYEFKDIDEACRQARTALAEMALDGLPDAPSNMYVIELQDERHRPIIRMRLLLETMLPAE